MFRNRISLTVLALLQGAPALGCGSADALRAEAPTAVDATGRPVCGANVGDHDEPLIIDMPPEQRGDLEVAMHGGVVAVAYDCKSLRVLPGCSLQGAYKFVGTGAKEQMVRLGNADSIRATLPLTGAGIAASLEAELARGTTLDLGLVMVGKMLSTRDAPTTDDLRGTCAGATHAVQSATLGAFSMATGSHAKVRSVSEVFAAGASASSESEKTVEAHEGRIDACLGARSGSSAPPAGCDAVLRLELIGIAEPLPPLTLLSQEKARSLWGKYCPDLEACRSGCDAGDASSCHSWAAAHMLGDRVPRDPGIATTLMDRACKLGEMSACALIGLALLTSGNRGASADRAFKYLERPCERGNAGACAAMASSYESAGNLRQARFYFNRACALGDQSSCERAR